MEAAVASAVRVPYLLQLVHMSGATAVYLLQPRKVGIYLELCSNGDIARTHDVPQSQRTFTYTFSQVRWAPPVTHMHSCCCTCLWRCRACVLLGLRSS